jgi:glycogen debranching enzyme
MAETQPAAAPVEPAHAPHSVHPGRDAIDDSVRILKHGDTFCVFDRHGDAMPGGRSSSGLYHDGTRHLSRLTLELAGDRPLLLKSTITHDNLLLAIDLTNPDTGQEHGIPSDTVHGFRGKLLRDGVMHEVLRLTNHGLEPVRFPVTWRFGADFVDVFEVRGTRRGRRGHALGAEVSGDCITLGYRGLDQLLRRTTIRATPRPTRIGADLIRYDVVLAPKEELTLELELTCHREQDVPAIAGMAWTPAYRALAAERTEARARSVTLFSDNPLFNRWLDRSVADLYMMLTDTPYGAYPYAGVPWYNTVFGRDGIWTALFTSWIDPEIMRGVLGYLAATQADRHDDARDAEPGKILHELRTGEMAALGEIPFGRYYGTIDATPLYVMLAGAYYQRTGDRATIEALWPNLERALAWIDAEGDLDGDGFLEYGRRSAQGLVQQGWKDSDDSVFHADGTVAPGPIALCEVQGYAYAAWRAGAQLARVLGHHGRAGLLDNEADAMRARFEEAFWCEKLGSYALALDGSKRRCAVKTSNPGHCLFTGIVGDPARARRVGAQMVGDELFSGWGVRTAGRLEMRYNPMSYHNGSVWPHDNAIVGAGMARYGMKAEALRILSALFDASVFMDLNRLPELMCGFSRKTGQGPTLYPVACSPQAWSSAAVYMLLAACLGLEIDAPAKVVRVVSPMLPPWLSWLDVRDLRVGAARLDVRVRRDGDRCQVEVLEKDGEVELVVA